MLANYLYYEIYNILIIDSFFFFCKPEVALFCLNMASNIGDGDGEMEHAGISCICDKFVHV